MPTLHPAEPHYTSAAVCRRGHVETYMLDDVGASERCVTCGQPVLVACPECSFRIRGVRLGGFDMATPYQPPDFCDNGRCGQPFPWASDQALIYAIENKLAEADLDEGDRRLLARRLEKMKRAFERGEGEEGAMVEALSFVKDRVPAVFNGLVPAITPLATAYVKQKLGLPPG